jgi:hypothetical protein
MLDVWVCATCHSINRERDARCYHCHGPRQAATGEGEGRREERAIVARLTNPVRSTTGIAVVAALLVVFAVALDLRSAWDELQAVPTLEGLLDRMAGGEALPPNAMSDAFAAVNAGALLELATAVAALVGLAAWLALSVGNIPGLGGGTPSMSPAWAFVSTLIPVVNFRRVPRILQEVLYRADPRGGGLLILAIAWVGLVGSWVVAWVSNVYLEVRIDADAFNSATPADFIASVRPLLGVAVGVDLIASAMTAVGALALILIVVLVEIRTARRNQAIDAALGPR